MPNKSGKRIGFFVLGGIHQILHFIPSAGVLLNAYDHDVVIFTRTHEEEIMCRNILKELDLPIPEIKILTAPKWMKKISAKLAVMFYNLRTLRGVDSLVVAERTSSLPLRLKLKMPPMILIQHGAGDRAESYNWRTKLFDHVICHGTKDKMRMQNFGLVTDQNCNAAGSQKAFALRKMNRRLPKLFQNDKPVIFYNPHFELSLSSFNTYAKMVLETFKSQDRYNLIFAPHIRLFSNKSDDERLEWQTYHDCSNIHVDLGSPLSTDMTYTRSADAYMGDISSQVYEFLLDPGPCIFLSNKPFNWAEDESYTHWQFGPVCENPSQLMAVINRAFTTHDDFLETQIRLRNVSMGDPDIDAPAKGAQIIHDFVSSLPNFVKTR